MKNKYENGWWENWVDSPEEEEYDFKEQIPHQRELIPPCYCDISYVCDECKKTPRKKWMTAI